MNKAYLLIGGNMGDRLANLQNAQTSIQSQIGSIILSSSIYETAAWGLEDQPSFLNQAFIVETTFTAHEVLKKLLAIEQSMGRIRQQPLGPRTIDLDIIFFNDQIIHTEDLTIPHPQMQNRNFVLAPLAEIAPKLLHPSLKKTMKQLVSQTSDALPIKKLLFS